MIFEERIYPVLYLEVTLDVDFIKEKSMQQVEMAFRGIRINQFFSMVKIFLYNNISLFSVSYLNLQHYCGSNITIIYIRKYGYIYKQLKCILCKVET